MKRALRLALKQCGVKPQAGTTCCHGSNPFRLFCRSTADCISQRQGPRLNHSLRWLSTGTVFSPAEIRSPFEDVQIPNVSFAEYMFSKCDEFKDLMAVEDFATGRKYTFKQLKDYSIKVASALHKKGYKKGDILATFTINLPEFTILVLAASAIGVIISPANPAYTASELSRQLSHSGATAVFTIAQLMPIVRDAIGDPDMPHQIKEVYTFGHATESTQGFHTLMEDSGKDFPDTISQINPMKDLLLLPYSSGTTGLPKGVMLSHHNIVANLLQIRELLRLEPGKDHCLGLLPFFHIYGLTAVQFGCLHMGGRLVTVPRFEPEMFLKALQQEKITVLHAVPPIVLFMAKHPIVSSFDVSSMRYMVSGAAPLGEGITLEFKKRLNIPVIQGYGLTETSPVINVDTLPGNPGTIGIVVPNTVCKLINVETGEPTKIGEMGEYCMNGPQKMIGYLHNQQATDEMIDKDGWLHTGDLGFMREDGMVIIEDRLKELIKYKGYQVPPAELEGLLLTHPAVQDAAVVGVPNEEAGELPRAYIVLKPNSSVSAADIIKFVEEKAAPSKRLRGGVKFIEQIPKTASGKILRRVLKAQVLQTS